MGQLSVQQYKTYFKNPDSVTAGGVTASLAGGCLLGTLFSSWTGDRIGRRDSMFCACAVFLVGSALMCAAQDPAMLIASRVVNGIAAGMLTTQGQVDSSSSSLLHLLLDAAMRARARDLFAKCLQFCQARIHCRNQSGAT
jgi:MFS family permease